MISEKQLHANRLNAQKSTGPKTEEGKSISSQNAIVHGLRSARPVIDGEDHGEYNDFRNDMVARFTPEGPMESLLVDRIVYAAWRLRRIGTIEVELYAFIRNELLDKERLSESKKAANESKRFNYPERLPGTRQGRFASFKEAKAAWDKTDDGITYAKGQWPMHPKCPTPDESFSQFYSQPPDLSNYSDLIDLKELPPQLDPAVPEHCLAMSEAIGRARSKTDSQEVHARLDKLQEKFLPPNSSHQSSLTMGRAVVDDMQGAQLLSRLTRYETSIERSMFKNLRQLQALQERSRVRQEGEPLDI